MPSSLHPLVQRAIHRVKAAGGSLDLAADFAAIARLNELAGRLDTPDLETRLSILYAPLTIGNVTLRRLTIAAEEWLTARSDWWSSDRVAILAVAYCMAHKATPDRFLGLHGRIATLAALQLWSLTVRAPFQALQDGVESLLPRPQVEPKPSTPSRGDTPGDDRAGCGQLVALLVTEYGRDVDYWLFEAPSELARSLVDGDFLPRKEREAAAYRSAGGKVQAPGWTYRAAAYKRFTEAAQAWVREKTASLTVQPATANSDRTVSRNPQATGSA